MARQYENQAGLLVKPGTNECCGYIIDFTGHGAFDPAGRVTAIASDKPTPDEIRAHNETLAAAELQAMIEQGKGVFYLYKEPWRTNEKGERIRSLSNDRVSNFISTWKTKAFVREGYTYGYCRVKTNWVWFTGPDGLKWYGVNKGDMDCFTGRRLKTQPKKGR